MTCYSSVHNVANPIARQCVPRATHHAIGSAPDQHHASDRQRGAEKARQVGGTLRESEQWPNAIEANIWPATSRAM